MSKSNFDDLMERYLNNQVSDAERKKIEAWLEVMKSEETTEMTLTPAEEEILFKKIKAKRDEVKDVVAFRPVALTKKTRSLNLIRWAASVLLMTSLLAIAYYFVRETRNELDGPAAMEKVILNDGSIVWLKPGSQLTYIREEQTRKRNVQFSGEALFEVAKDPESPFIISCEGLQAQVLGTSFSLTTEQGSLQLKVLTGKVRLSTMTSKNTAEITPGIGVTFSDQGITNTINLSEKDISELLAGTEYRMQFRNQSILEAMERIEKKFDVIITMDKKKFAHCNLTADFTDQSLNTTLSMISDVLDIEFEMKANEIVATGPGCRK